MQAQMFQCSNCKTVFSSKKIILWKDVEYFGYHPNVPMCPNCHTLGRCEDIGFIRSVQPLNEEEEHKR